MDVLRSINVTVYTGQLLIYGYGCGQSGLYTEGAEAATWVHQIYIKVAFN